MCRRNKGFPVAAFGGRAIYYLNQPLAKANRMKRSICEFSPSHIFRKLYITDEFSEVMPRFPDSYRDRHIYVTVIGKSTSAKLNILLLKSFKHYARHGSRHNQKSLND